MQNLKTKDVAEMLGKRHDNFLREVKRYVAALGEGAAECFVSVTYKDGRGVTREGYEITLKGCEYIAGNLIGTKSEDFKRRYMEILKPEAAEEMPVAAAEPKGYTSEEAAKVLGCSGRTVRRMIQRGELATTQVTVLVPTVKTIITAEELSRYQKERVE